MLCQTAATLIEKKKIPGAGNIGHQPTVLEEGESQNLSEHSILTGSGEDVSKSRPKMSAFIRDSLLFGHKGLLPFQNGILFSNKSLLDLKCNLNDTYKMKYLLTTKLNVFLVLEAWGACMITQMHFNLCTASDGTSWKDIQQR